MVLQGKAAAPGAAVGRIFIYNEKLTIPEENFVPSGEEQSQFEKYIKIKNQAIGELEKIKLSMEKTDPVKALIFDAQKEIADDILINEDIKGKIINEKCAADWAIYHVYENVLGVLKKTHDPLIAERAADFNDVRALLLKLWYGRKVNFFSDIDEPVIIAAKEIMPSNIASLDKEKILAIITETGGVTSHTAVIAKSYGIPAVFGIEGLLNTVKQNQIAAIDAGKAVVILDPADDVIREYKNKCEDLRKDREDAARYRQNEGRTSCGVKIDIGLNISGTSNEELNASSFVDSVGVFRTEFIYMGRSKLPSEDDQFLIYKKVMERFGTRSVILRTLDIGGDKKLSCMELPAEDNPFLGNRALRFCFSSPAIFKTQLRAALRASVYGNLWLMLPMVASIEDIRKAKEIIASVRGELDNEGISYKKDFKTGIMIEIPSIALIAEAAAKEVDFASIGSNDLCQYLCAADRMNVSVESYYQSYHPAMLFLIKKVVTAFNDAGKSISLCGEIGGDPGAVPLLLGLGLRKISMGGASVAAVKRAIASVTIKKVKEIADKALQMETAAEIEKYILNY